MTTYAFPAGRYTTATDLQNAVGQQYHLGLSAPLGAGAAALYYGYLLEPEAGKSGGFHQRSDTASKDALISYSSPNLIDRDIAYFPRVTDGDFSGGGFQEVWLQASKYFDSDLDPRIPGYLQLRPQWTRISKAGLTVGTNFQVVPFASDFFYTFGESNGNVYSANGAGTGTAGNGAVLGLDTDGSFLYAITATHIWQSTNGASWTQIDASLQGTPTQVWVINQGTNGYFAYYLTSTNVLWKLDLTVATPVPLANQVQVPVGKNAISIIDLCEYQTSIAVLTQDVRGPGSDVWYFDGQNLTRIVRLEGYIGQGICQSLGSLYVGGYAVGQTTSPKLFQISSGSVTEVVIPGSPFAAASQSCLQPRSSGRFVYWPITTPSINGISNGKGVVLQYDVVSGAVSKLPNQDATDFTTTGGTLRAIAALGDNVACIWNNAGTGVLQYQSWAFGSIKYQSSGWVASSHIDFTTPGIMKRFRRIEVHHAPLNAGESITIEAFVDTDPLAFTTSLTPVPATATATNSALNSALTAMTFGQDTIGKTLYFALKLASSTNNTSPRVSYVSIEVGGTWAWELNLACTSKRQLLDGQNEDTQGVRGQDLAYLILIAYEQGQNLTLYHRNGQSYTVAIESADGWNVSPIRQSRAQDIVDEEWIVKCTLRQVA